MREALYYKYEGGSFLCLLCPVLCRIPEGGAGRCGVRRATGGVLTTQYGQAAAVALDPMEKKPLYHYYPGCSVLSVGGYGCNLTCAFCQNYTLSQGVGPFEQILPEKLIDLTAAYGAAAIAFTYNEPLIQPEYIIDTAKLARVRGIGVVLVTNGYIEPGPLSDLLPWVDAMNIDIKGTDEAFYRKVCGGRLEPVKKTVAAAAFACHVEITTLVIEGLNDNADAMEPYFKWLAALSPDIPLHLTRYFPAHLMDLPPTSPDRLFALAEIARKFLSYVYIGNLPGADINTACPCCGAVLIKRGAKIDICGLKRSFCMNCGKRIPITVQHL